MFEYPKKMRDEGVLVHMPWGVRHVVFALLTRYMSLMLFFQGTGRNTNEENKKLRREAVAIMADSLADPYEKADKGTKKPFWVLGGEKPTEADLADEKLLMAEEPDWDQKRYDASCAYWAKQAETHAKPYSPGVEK